MTGKIFIGNTNNTASSSKQILFGDQNNIAKSISSVFIGNPSNMAVKVWDKSGGGGGDLPSTYTAVQYIRSTCNATRFSFTKSIDNTIRIKTSFMFISIDFEELLEENGSIASLFYVKLRASTDLVLNNTTGCSLFLGATQSTEQNGIDYYLRVCFGSSENSYYDIYSYHSPNNTYDREEVMENIGNNILNKRINVDLNRSEGKLYVNNILVHTFENPTFNLTDDFYIYKYNSLKSIGANRTSTSNQINLYNFTIYQNDNIFYNFIPVKRTSTGIGSLYETIHHKNQAAAYANSDPLYVGPVIS